MRSWLQSRILVMTCMVLNAWPMLAVVHPVQVCVQDDRGQPIVGARVQVRGDSPRVVVSDASGCAGVSAETPEMVEIKHDGFVPVVQTVGDDDHLVVVMRVAGASEEVEVTAARAPLALDASASSVRTMTGEQLREAPGFTLDDRLRQVAGFQLFRRTSSWVANPTTEGTTLRGLGSTAASRTLVLTDQVPLNDA
jgi:hypothetical protein